MPHNPNTPKNIRYKESVFSQRADATSGIDQTPPATRQNRDSLENSQVGNVARDTCFGSSNERPNNSVINLNPASGVDKTTIVIGIKKWVSVIRVINGV